MSPLKRVLGTPFRGLRYIAATGNGRFREAQRKEYGENWLEKECQLIRLQFLSQFIMRLDGRYQASSLPFDRVNNIVCKKSQASGAVVLNNSPFRRQVISTSGLPL